MTPYTSETYAAMLARDNLMREYVNPLESYEVIGTPTGGIYKDGSKQKDWYIVYYYANHMTMVNVKERRYHWKNYPLAN